MMPRSVAAMLAIGLTGIALIAGLLLTPTPVPVPASGVSRSPVAPPVALPHDPLAPLRDPVTVIDGLFDDRAPRTLHAPSTHKNQSKLFFADGRWWGVLHEPITREARIMWLDWATQRWHDTGVVVDERSFARADVLFQDDRLYVTSAGDSTSAAHAIRVSTFDYDRVTERWSLRPDFPVTVNNTGVESSVIERADDGELWVAYVENGFLSVSHATGDQHVWATPYRPVVTGTEVAIDQVGMVAVRGEVILLWSNQNDEAIYATSHRDGEPDEAWTPPTTILQGLRLADNHVNFKSLPDGRLFAAIKTSLDTVPGAQPGWDQILLISRVEGRWSSQQVGQIRDRHTRPIVVLDSEDDQALVFATTPNSGGTIVMKRAPFEQPRFPTGKGVEVIVTTPDARTNNATSTKQPVNAATGLVVLASDDESGRYIHLAASLGGPPPGAPPTGSPPDGPERAPKTPIGLVDERSDGQTVGQPIQPLWRMAPNRADGTVSYTRRATNDVAVQLRTDGPGELRPCRSFARAIGGRLTMSLDVRLDRQGVGDSILLLARGDGQELGSLRLDDLFRVRVSKLYNRETTDVRLRPGRWYRAELDLDVASRTFRARLFDASGQRLLQRTTQAWRAAAVDFVDALCVASSTGRAGLGLTFDNVKVTRTP